MSRKSLFTPRLATLKQHYAISGLQQAWKLLAAAPGGRRVFATLLGRLVPYSGTVKPTIMELEPGRAKVSMNDHAAIRNHLGSIHALALANIGEMACGLALNIGLPSGCGAILKRIDVEYLKKARGRVTSECDIDLRNVDFQRDSVVVATSHITDAVGTVVARAHTEWKVGPIAKTQSTTGAGQPSERPQ